MLEGAGHEREGEVEMEGIAGTDRRERRLVIGLGNALAGDDGVGSHIVRRLSQDSRLPADLDVLEGGTDLLRLAHELDGRPRVVLVDALLDPGEPGTLLQIDGDLEELEERGGGVHHHCSLESLRLLRCLYPSMRRVPMTFLAVTIRGVSMSHDLTPPVQARLDSLVDAVLGVLSDGWPVARPVHSSEL
jgi:hydrogenase maturation protease